MIIERPVLQVYLVRGEAVQRSDWSRIRRLQLTQVGQQRQLSVLIGALVLPVKDDTSTET